MMAAAAVTRRVNAIASLDVEATNGVVAGEESRRSSSAADDSPVAKRIDDAAAKDNDVWVAIQEGDMPAGNSSQPVLFRTMKVKGSILHPYRLLCHFGPSNARLSVATSRQQWFASMNNPIPN
jgi:hypothetical protein